MRRKTSLLSAAGLGAAVLLLAPGHAGASSGSIQGGTVDDIAQRAHVDNLSLTMDECGAGDHCSWGAEAYLSLGLGGTGYDCPTRPQPYHSRLIWVTSDGSTSELYVYSANGTAQSGPLDFEGSGRDLVCLYLDTEINFFYSTTLVASKQLVSTGLSDKDKALKKCKKKHKHHAASAKKHCKKHKKR